MEISFGPITFSSKFDSGNLFNVEQVCISKEQRFHDNNGITEDYAFNLWTSPDAVGTSYENGNRTWFYFSVRGPLCATVMKFTIMNMNRQGRLYRQGFAPLFKTHPAKNPTWQRIKEKPTFEQDGQNFKLSFIHKFAESTTKTYFAFCYPFSYSECQQYISSLENAHPFVSEIALSQEKDIYFHRDTLIYSNNGLKMDLLTITSMKGITKHHEKPIHGLYPDDSLLRARIFRDKKIFVLTSRVHPGETPASFVFNGFLNFILRKDDHRASVLRDLFVFKMVPMLNPDGVKSGHYRTDTYGVNLNRTYTNPDIFLQPTIFAIKSLMMYHHFKRTDPKLCCNVLDTSASERTVNISNVKSDKSLHKSSTAPCLISVPKVQQNIEGDVLFRKNEKLSALTDENTSLLSHGKVDALSVCDLSIDEKNSDDNQKRNSNSHITLQDTITKLVDEGGIDFYVDLHGHASKRGCFIYGNYIEHEQDMVECLLYPKLISLNSLHFDFNACNFTEKNMYHKDKKDGLSKEGSGRVSMFKTLGLVHSYTLECNYNTGLGTNFLSPATCDNGRATPPSTLGFPPKYAPEHYEEVGQAAAVALLDVYDCNPWSRVPSSEYNSVSGVRDWVRRYANTVAAKKFMRQDKSLVKVDKGISSHKVTLQSSEKGKATVINIGSTSPSKKNLFSEVNLPNNTSVSPAKPKLSDVVNSFQKVRPCERSFKKNYHSEGSNIVSEIIIDNNNNGDTTTVTTNNTTVTTNNNDNSNNCRKEIISSKSKKSCCKNKVIHINSTRSCVWMKKKIELPVKHSTDNDIDQTKTVNEITVKNKQSVFHRVSSHTKNGHFNQDKMPRRNHSNIVKEKHSIAVEDKLRSSTKLLKRRFSLENNHSGSSAEFTKEIKMSGLSHRTKPSCQATSSCQMATIPQKKCLSKRSTRQKTRSLKTSLQNLDTRSILQAQREEWRHLSSQKKDTLDIAPKRKKIARRSLKKKQENSSLSLVQTTPLATKLTTSLTTSATTFASPPITLLTS